MAPHWPETQWHKQLMALDVHYQLWNQPLYLTADGRLRRAPRWATIFIHLPGVIKEVKCVHVTGSKPSSMSKRPDQTCVHVGKGQ